MGLDLASGSGFASESGYENPMGQTPCCIMWSTHNQGIKAFEGCPDFAIRQRGDRGPDFGNLPRGAQILANTKGPFRKHYGEGGVLETFEWGHPDFAIPPLPSHTISQRIWRDGSWNFILWLSSCNYIWIFQGLL